MSRLLSAPPMLVLCAALAGAGTHCSAAAPPLSGEGRADAGLAEGNDGGSEGGPANGPDGGDAGGGADGDDAAAVAACPPSWSVTPTCGGTLGATPPDLGPNVRVFAPSMPMASIQSQLDAIYAQQDSAQFGTGRYALLFKPGAYALDVKVGFYTQVLGLGRSPDDVAITGAVRAKADWLGNNNATCNFWRGAENLSVTPDPSIDSGVDVWAVSQGTHLRRVHVKGDLVLDDGGGWSSGGFIADSLVDGTLDSGTQQQFLTRNDDLTWQGSNWNMVFVGDVQAPSGTWPSAPYTVMARTPRVREKPFLYVDSTGSYLVMVPGLRTDAQGRSWASGAAPGVPLSIDRFYVARPGDTAATMNAGLASGRHLLFTPGIYHLESSIEVTQPGTVVLGLGLATLVADNGTPLVSVADVDGVTLAGLLLEAGPTRSPTLLEVGPPGSAQGHVAAPTAVLDVHCRVGGADVGTASRCVTVNSNDVLLDDTWLWRADHGAGAAWNVNMADHGLVVNGSNVTAYGLFVEHFQKFQTLWNGEDGAVYFYQSEMPYDPPDQASWMEAPGVDGYPSYKVADTVTTHTAEGLGVYSVFTNDVTAANGLETPTGAGISMHHMVTVSLASGSIANIIDGTGGSVGHGTMTAFSSN